MKKILSAIGAKNIVIISGILLVGLAVYINIRFSPLPDASLEYSGEWEGIGSQDELDRLLGQSLLVNAGSRGDDYFAVSALNRGRARDETMDILQTVVDASEALPDARAAALADIAKIAMAIEQEANIEALIRAKGFEDCVAVVSGDIASVIVKTAQLLPNQAAQIKEIVCEQAGIPPNNIKIIERN